MDKARPPVSRTPSHSAPPRTAGRKHTECEDVMENESNIHVLSDGDSLPKKERGQGQDLRAQAAAARATYLHRQKRWRDIVDILEERTLKVAKDPKSDNTELVRLATLVRSMRELKQRESALSLTRKTEWQRKH